MSYAKSGIRITNTFKKNMKNLESNSLLMKDKILMYLALLSEEVLKVET